ncbi:MAG TPA: MXAN_5187 C-terminal domain-containing protein [Polyangiales bacterium]
MSADYRPPPPAIATAGNAQKAPPVPRPAAAAKTTDGPARTATSGQNLSADELHRIYEKYLAARKQNSERTDNVKLETIEKSLRGMLPQLEKKHAGKKIDFEVVVKDGKVALKPVAK